MEMTDSILYKSVRLFSRRIQNGMNVLHEAEKDNVRPMPNQADAKYTNPNSGKIRNATAL